MPNETQNTGLAAGRRVHRVGAEAGSDTDAPPAVPEDGTSTQAWSLAASGAELLDAIGESVIVTDPAGKILFWNSVAEATHGWSAAEVVGRFVLDVIEMADPTDGTEIAERLRSGRSWRDEVEMRRRDGSTFLSMVTSTPVFGDDGALVAHIGVGRDITDLRASRQAVATSRRRFRALVEGSGVLFATTDGEGIIRSLDGPFEAHFGVEPSGLIGTSVFDLIRPDDLERAHDQWAQRLLTTTPLPADDYWTQRGDGTWMCLNLLASNLLDDPDVAGMVITGLDVTLNKHLERARIATAGTNAALVHATSETGLLREICEVVADDRLYHLAWVGFADPSESLGVRMVAFSDRSGGYIDALEALAGEEGYTGPLTQALKTRELFVVQDVEALPDTVTWRHLALDFGYRSIIALPLPFTTDEYGVLAIYSEEPNAFNDDTVRVLTELAADTAFGIDALRSRADAIRYRGRFEASLEAAVRAIATAAELRDPYTAGHQRRVAQLSIAMATEIGLDAEQIAGIGVAASIHDIGKLLVPAEILSKPGRLSDAEFSIIREHPQAGHDIVAGIDFPWPIAEMILQHHERLDGSGYPNHLLGDQIVTGARIIAVADVVEAMQSHRPYRPGLGIPAALRQIESDRASLLDATVVDACLHLFREKGFRFEQ